VTAAGQGPISLVSVTRFRLRSIRFLPVFVLHTNRAIAQIRKSDGFIAGAVRRDAGLAFWTLTVWRDEQAMRAYGASFAHREARPHLAEWADEASVGHWEQQGSELPAWSKAVRGLREHGRPVPLRHPAPTHTAHAFAEPLMANGMRL
jgi:hypothetical protein